MVTLSLVMHNATFCYFTSNFPLLVRAISCSLLTERVFSSEELFDSASKLYVYMLTVELLWDKRSLMSSVETSVLPARKISCVEIPESKSNLRKQHNFRKSKSGIFNNLPCVSVWKFLLYILRFKPLVLTLSE